jgi:hypothetical protein
MGSFTESLILLDFFDCKNGDPSRTEISNDIKHLGWQTYLNAFIEPKGTFGPLANREARHAATSIALGSPAAAKRIRGKFGIEAKGRLQ